MKHLIKIESTAHGVLGVRHAGLDQQYCESGEQVILKWQPDAKWGLQEAHYTDGDGNIVAIDLTRVKVDGKDEVVFTMPNDNITVGGTFKRFVVQDWTDGETKTDVEIFASGSHGEPVAVTLEMLANAMAYNGIDIPTPINAETTGLILPNVFCELNELTGATTIELDAPVGAGLSHYYFTFSTGATAPTVTFPALNWVGGSAPVIAANTRYEISIIDGFAAWLEFTL